MLYDGILCVLIRNNSGKYMNLSSSWICITQNVTYKTAI